MVICSTLAFCESYFSAVYVWMQEQSPLLIPFWEIHAHNSSVFPEVELEIVQRKVVDAGVVFVFTLMRVLYWLVQLRGSTLT